MATQKVREIALAERPNNEREDSWSLYSRCCGDRECAAQGWGVGEARLTGLLGVLGSELIPSIGKPLNMLDIILWAWLVGAGSSSSFSFAGNAVKRGEYKSGGEGERRKTQRGWRQRAKRSRFQSVVAVVGVSVVGMWVRCEVADVGK